VMFNDRGILSWCGKCGTEVLAEEDESGEEKCGMCGKLVYADIGEYVDCALMMEVDDEE